jgi:general nucleoside transport system permease protein
LGGLGGNCVIRAERRESVPTAHVIVAQLIAAVFSLLIAIALLPLTGISALSLIRAIPSAFGSSSALADMVALAASLIFTGLAAALTFRAGLINLGVEGQVIASALAAIAVTAGVVPVPALALAPIAVVVAVATGALSVAVVVILKRSFQVDEAVLTLLLNIVLIIALQLMSGSAALSLPPVGSAQAMPLANVWDFPAWPGLLHRYLAPPLAIVACLLVFGVMRYTIWGFDIRATGGNPVAARFAGINVRLVQLNIGLLSGALIALAAAGEMVDAAARSTPTLTVGLGYGGITVAFLAGLEPLGIIPAALFIAALVSCVKVANQMDGLPLALSNVMLALALVAALIAHCSVRYRLRLPSRNKAS